MSGPSAATAVALPATVGGAAAISGPPAAAAPAVTPGPPAAATVALLVGVDSLPPAAAAAAGSLGPVTCFNICYSALDYVPLVLIYILPDVKNSPETCHFITRMVLQVVFRD